ncbi:hypothetical protein LWP59_27625 [Amycolatopsis acidiphila]|uniref:hypothetical protein n=1 Tax=Amycolatopsis acidiphila TaxID=715473 RepID=UPI001F20B712|nr:hypothetical protein [Amycolatopsis acidiphila]UIJ57886.1 hypothetical protein LWP59_27625 [Amycolatopsis acidiphila]
MSRRQAEASFDGLDVDYDHVLAAQANAVHYTDALELADAADLLEDIDRELAAASTAALIRAPRFIDPRRAARSRRRANRRTCAACTTVSSLTRRTTRPTVPSP